jgi:hypothetical protein
VSDAELVETFIGQAGRYTHSRLKLRDCFSRTAFDQCSDTAQFCKKAPCAKP